MDYLHFPPAVPEVSVRLEQLVLFRPSDNFMISFGPRITVLSGLEPDERAATITTLVDALAGRIPNASVIFEDSAGRKVFADRTGATFADSGTSAPPLSDLLGHDSEAIEDLLCIRASDLAVDIDRTPADIESELAAATDEQHKLGEEQAQARVISAKAETARSALAELDTAIDAHADQSARWTWICRRRDLDALRGELATLEQAQSAVDEEGDKRILGAVEDLRTAGSDWTEASAAAAELELELGGLPSVSEADLLKVASTPDAPPEDFQRRLQTVELATKNLVEAERALSDAQAPLADPGDGVVYELARMDQTKLWETYDAAVSAQRQYEAERRDHEDDLHNPDLDTNIEEAHREVVRAQREVERRSRPGLIATGALVATALLSAQQISPFLAVIFLAGAAGAGWWLLAIPRKELAAASRKEKEALAGSEADSWLGLHLQRIDDVTSSESKPTLSGALDRCTKTQLDWEELSPGVSLQTAGEKREAITAHAADLDPSVRSRRLSEATQSEAEAKMALNDARAAIEADLKTFGLTQHVVDDLTSGELHHLLAQRSKAGRVARRVLELNKLKSEAMGSTKALDDLLRNLGFTDGELSTRLERAIIAVEAARERQSDSGPQRKTELEKEIADLSAELDTQRRLSWDLTPDPVHGPEDRDLLITKRHELALQLSDWDRTDLPTIDRQLEAVTQRVKSLADELLNSGTSSSSQRLADRFTLSTRINDEGEVIGSLPLIMDDPFIDSDPDELVQLLDMTLRLSAKTQVVLFTGDRAVGTWARHEAGQGNVTLFESDASAAY